MLSSRSIINIKNCSNLNLILTLIEKINLFQNKMDISLNRKSGDNKFDIGLMKDTYYFVHNVKVICQ